MRDQACIDSIRAHAHHSGCAESDVAPTQQAVPAVETTTYQRKIDAHACSNATSRQQEARLLRAMGVPSELLVSTAAHIEVSMRGQLLQSGACICTRFDTQKGVGVLNCNCWCHHTGSVPSGLASGCTLRTQNTQHMQSTRAHVQVCLSSWSRRLSTRPQTLVVWRALARFSACPSSSCLTSASHRAASSRASA